MSACVSADQESVASIFSHLDHANLEDIHRSVDYLKVSDIALSKIKELVFEGMSKFSNLDLNGFQDVESKMSILMSSGVALDEIPCGLKISTPTKGCSGLAYKIEFAHYGRNIFKHDELLKIDGVKIFIELKSTLFLFDTTMDYKESDLEYGFVFVNPNEKGRCGCGESFYV